MAATTESFVLLIAGMAALGASSASTNSCRYAATDLAPKDRRAITLSMVVWVATVGAVVERSHRIDAEEFYRLLDGAVIDDVNIFNARLKEWQSYYNYERSPSAAHFGQSGPSEEPARVVDLEWSKPAMRCRQVSSLLPQWPAQPQPACQPFREAALLDTACREQPQEQPFARASVNAGLCTTR